MSRMDRLATMRSHAVTSVRIVLATMAVCCLLYGGMILSFGQLVTPHGANGSLVRNGRGEVVGSLLIAQGFSRPEYFWPRPSAVDYNASAAGGSNLSPMSPELRSRAQAILAQMVGAGERPIPADLVAASGSGLDPHITLDAATVQAERVASARGLSVEAVERVLEKCAERPGGVLTPGPLVNVLVVNMTLDSLEKGYGR